MAPVDDAEIALAREGVDPELSIEDVADEVERIAVHGQPSILPQAASRVTGAEGLGATSSRRNPHK
jgi:hypothetical protein